MAVRSGSIVPIMLLLSGTAYAADQAGGQSEALGSALADIAKMPDLFTGTWRTMAGFVEDDKKRVPPFTPAAQKYVDSYKHKRDIPYAQDGCLTPGLPLAQRIGPINFSYSPGLISIYMGTAGHTRFIRMNQKHGTTTPKYYGNSVGHWEGDTLVVKTVDFVPEITFQYGVGTPLPPEETRGTFSLGGPPGGGPPGSPPAGGPPGGSPPGGAPPAGGPPPGGGPPGGPFGAPVPGEPLPSLASLSAAIWGPHGEGMYMVERMRLVGKDALEIKTTTYDDTVWTKPYESQRTYRRLSTGVPGEWICTVSITNFDPETNTYEDKTPEEMVKYLDKLGR